MGKNSFGRQECMHSELALRLCVLILRRTISPELKTALQRKHRDDYNAHEIGLVIMTELRARRTNIIQENWA